MRSCFSGKLRNCARWSEIFAAILPERVSALASVRKISINVFNHGVIHVGDVICGIREVEQISSRK